MDPLEPEDAPPDLSGTWDAVVVGGGVAGSAAALSLGASGHRVLLVEAGGYQGFRVGETLPPAARPVLQQLGVLDAFLNEGHLPCHGSCSVWGRETVGHNDFTFHPNGHGWHLDRRRFEGFLARQAVVAGATLATGTRLVGVKPCGASGFDLSFSGPGLAHHRVRARAVVDATGPGAVLARHLGAARRVEGALLCHYAVLDLGQTGVALRPQTYLEAVEDGWWYLARLPGDTAIAAFFTTAERGRPYLDAACWMTKFSNTCHVSRMLANKPITVDGIRTQLVVKGYLDRCAGPGWMAIGDAAFSCDPILSQGMYAALLGGQQAGARLAHMLAGPTQSVPVAPDSARRLFEDSARRVSMLYASETRWAGSPFWRAQQKGQGSSAEPLREAVLAQS